MIEKTPLPHKVVPFRMEIAQEAQNRPLRSAMKFVPGDNELIIEKVKYPAISHLKPAVNH